MERDIKNAIRAYLNKHDCFAFHYSAMYGVPGIPDIIVVNDSHVFFIEVKMPGCNPTPIQEAVHKKLRNQRCIVLVSHSLEELKEQLMANNIILHKI